MKDSDWYWEVIGVTVREPVDGCSIFTTQALAWTPYSLIYSVAPYSKKN